MTDTKPKTLEQLKAEWLAAHNACIEALEAAPDACIDAPDAAYYVARNAAYVAYVAYHEAQEKSNETL